MTHEQVNTETERRVEYIFRRSPDELRRLTLQANVLRPITERLLLLSTSPLPVPASWYAIPLRLIVGFGFIQHGYAKLARGPEDFIGVLHAMGLPLSFMLGWLTIIVELVGGLMILVGALIPLATIPMMIVLFVAIITVHLPNGFSSIKLQSFDAAGAHFGQPGYETDLLYLAGLIALCFGGPGPFSFDGWLNRLFEKHEQQTFVPTMRMFEHLRARRERLNLGWRHHNGLWI